MLRPVRQQRRSRRGSHDLAVRPNDRPSRLDEGTGNRFRNDHDRFSSRSDDPAMLRLGPDPPRAELAIDPRSARDRQPEPYLSGGRHGEAPFNLANSSPHRPPATHKRRTPAAQRPTRTHSMTSGSGFIAPSSRSVSSGQYRWIAYLPAQNLVDYAHPGGHTDGLAIILAQGRFARGLPHRTKGFGPCAGFDHGR